MGSSAYKNSAATAGTMPIPKSGIIIASKAIDGIVCNRPAIYKTGFEIAGIAESNTPMGKAIRIASSNEMNVICRCRSVF